MPEKKLIHSVEKAMNLLEILYNEKRPLSLNELFELTGLPKSTIHGLLSTMREFSVINQNKDGKYELGIRLFEYGCSVSSAWNICDIAKPYLQQISQVTGESTFLSIFGNDNVLTLSQEESRSNLRVVSDIGVRLPVHCTSQGKLFLAYLPENISKRIIRNKDFIAYTPHTIVDPELFQKELLHITQQGYSIENGEYKIGLRSISAPIYDASGKISYAIGVVGMFRRIDSDEFKKAINEVVEAGKKISGLIGYNPIMYQQHKQF